MRFIKSRNVIRPAGTAQIETAALADGISGNPLMSPDYPSGFIDKVTLFKNIRRFLFQESFIIVVGNKTDILTFGLTENGKAPLFR